MATDSLSFDRPLTAWNDWQAEPQTPGAVIKQEAMQSKEKTKAAFMPSGLSGVWWNPEDKKGATNDSEWEKIASSLEPISGQMQTPDY